MNSSVGLSPRARVLLPILLVALVLATAHRLACAPAAGPYHEFAGPTMGTTYSVKVASDALDASALRAIGDRIQERLDTVNRAMSTWLPESELMRFNASLPGTPFPAEDETLAVFEVARRVSEASGGAFDVTVAPLVAAWGFGARASAEADPAPDALAQAAVGVGFENVTVDLQRRTLTRNHAATRCDLSAIAKGFAVDEVSRALVDMGYPHHLVEVGGELRARGQRRDGRVWRVAIERPEDGAQRTVQLILELEDRSLATSGDYRSYYERDGVRMSHTIDPRTRHPIRHGLASVSVVHEEAVWADAWATALNVLGPEAGYSLAVDQGLAAYFIVRDPEGDADRFEQRATPAFEELRRPALPST